MQNINGLGPSPIYTKLIISTHYANDISGDGNTRNKKICNNVIRNKKNKQPILTLSKGTGWEPKSRRSFMKVAKRQTEAK